MLHKKIKFLCLFLTMGIAIVRAQSSFEKTLLQPSGSDMGQTYIYGNNTFRFDISPQTGKWIFHFGDTGGRFLFDFEIPQQTDCMEPVFFVNSKHKTSILVLVPIKLSFNEGCLVFACTEAKSAEYIGFLDVAAYSKTDEGYMDYNSVAPYTTVIEINDRWVFSFEIPFVVLSPGSSDEEILKGNAIFYRYSKDGWELKRN